MEDAKREYRRGNMVTRLVMLNVAVFVFVNILKIVLRAYYGFETNQMQGYDDVINFLMISSDMWHNLTHPWVFITSIFLHEGFMHILFNMLFLYWFGAIVGDLVGDRHILPLYLLGGLIGGVAFIGSAILLNYGGGDPVYALGASGAVMSIVVASAVIAPEYEMNLLLIGRVKLKYIVMVLVFLDMISVANNTNTGGHFAHLGGVFFGWLYVQQLRTGNDLSVPVNNFFSSIKSFFGGLRKPKGPHVVYRNKSAKRPHASSDTHDLSHQEKLDSILEKIKKAGYDSLTEEEKEFLFKASKK